ncbi:MAG: argininosuccinate lyase [Candidatus Omnitrophica bacterium]|nr:argininosuccinate lyase [Candidatus Omnitrophota bacterium]
MTKLWGSRFERGTDSLADQFSFSISYDQQLALYDVIGGIAHARMLGTENIIAQPDANKIVKGLKEIAQEIEEGKFKVNLRSEDIHTHVQSVLKNKIGTAADKLHTARSRNDLIVLDMKLYCLVELTLIINLLARLQKSILKCAQENIEVIIPAYTHLQAAQVVLASHHLLAYIEMLERDKERLLGALDRTDMMPLGSCALSGTSLPINRKKVAEELGFSGITNNSMDSVSDRDFIVEAIANMAIIVMHTSRMSEDLIVWATSEFNFVDIDWVYCTGSSIMPHKKNPDILELIRGETATVYGYLQQILVLNKGLPLTYNRDLQLDKPPLFNSVEKIKEIVTLLERVFATLSFKKDVLSKRITAEAFFSVDIMEYLIEKGVSYRDAHDTIGRMIKECVDKGKKIASLTKEELQAYHPVFELDVKKRLNPFTSVRLKKSFGSTSPRMVKSQMKRWQKKIG